MTGASQTQHTFAKASQRKKFENHCSRLSNNKPFREQGTKLLFKLEGAPAKIESKSGVWSVDKVTCSSSEREVDAEAAKSFRSSLRLTF